MSIWGKLLAAGGIMFGLAILLFSVGVMASDSTGLLVLSIVLSAMAPALLLVGLVGYLMTRKAMKE